MKVGFKTWVILPSSRAHQDLDETCLTILGVELLEVSPSGALLIDAGSKQNRIMIADGSWCAATDSRKIAKDLVMLSPEVK